MSKRLLNDLPRGVTADIASRLEKGERGNVRVALASKKHREDHEAWLTKFEHHIAEIHSAIAHVNKVYDKLVQADPYVFESLSHERVPAHVMYRAEESLRLQNATAEERGDRVVKDTVSIKSLDSFIHKAEERIDYYSATSGNYDHDDDPSDVPAIVPDSLAHPNPEENCKSIWPKFAQAVKAYKTVALSASALAKIITMYKCYSLKFSVGGNGRVGDIFGNTRYEQVLSDAEIEKVVRKHLTDVGVQLPTAGGKRKSTQSGSKASVGAPRRPRVRNT